MFHLQRDHLGYRLEILIGEQGEILARENIFLLAKKQYRKEN
jgi:hypothetical protein